MLLKRLEIEKKLKTNSLAGNVKISNRDKVTTVKKAAKEISQKLHSSLSESKKYDYLKKELGLGTAERKKVMSIFENKFNREDLVKKVQGFQNKRTQLMFLKKAGIEPEERAKIVREAGPKRVSEYLRDKDYSGIKGGAIGLAREKEDKKKASLGLSSKKVKSVFSDGKAKFAGSVQQKSKFAGGSLDSESRPLNNSGDAGGTKPMGF
ncbi:hypothetical protein KAI92_05250 [Candidatus Parcubacteria bacterium]|nr:hypothetical protein [Candidatus Parcubacteria bacterium]